MSAVRARLDRAGVIAWGLWLGVVVGLLVALGIEHVGLKVPALLLALALGLALVLSPRVALIVLAGSVVVFEDDALGFLPALRFYDVGVGKVRAVDLMILVLIAAVLLDDDCRRRLLHAAGPFTLPLLLLLGGVVLGTVVGVFDSADHSALLNSDRRLAYLLVVPVLTAAVLDSRRALRAALAIAAALVAYKTLTGMAGWLLGQGREVDGSVLTYYSPTANWLNLLFLLAVGAALIRRAPIPRGLVWMAPVTLAVLILSFRRNFWIALVLGGLLLVLVASGRRGRQLMIPAATLAALALFLGYGALSTSQSDSPVVARVQSLSPTKLESGAYDRYRIDEQRNVRAEIARSPLVGIGLGVPWTARYPLAVSFGSALRDYSHVVLTWYWLKMGIIGVAAYLLLMGTAVVTGIRLWRGSGDDLMRIPGLALGIGFVGLVVAEGTGSYTGVDPRMTVLVGVCLGWLAAATRIAAAERADAW
jgi:hypothetical protein